MNRTQKLMASVTAVSAVLLAAGCSRQNNCDPRVNPNCTSNGGYYSGGHYYGGGSGYSHSSGGGFFGGFGGHGSASS